VEERRFSAAYAVGKISTGFSPSERSD